MDAWDFPGADVVAQLPQGTNNGHRNMVQQWEGQQQMRDMTMGP